jgi:hypothetical protein
VKGVQVVCVWVCVCVVYGFVCVYGGRKESKHDKRDLLYDKRDLQHMGVERSPSIGPRRGALNFKKKRGGGKGA